MLQIVAVALDLDRTVKIVADTPNGIPEYRIVSLKDPTVHVY